MSRYRQLIRQLKLRWKTKVITVTDLEDMMDEMNLPEDYEVDYEKVVVDMTAYKINYEHETIRHLNKKLRHLSRMRETQEQKKQMARLIENRATLENLLIIYAKHRQMCIPVEQSRPINTAIE